MRFFSMLGRAHRALVLMGVLVGAAAILPKAWNAFQILVLDDTVRMMDYRLKTLSSDDYAGAIKDSLAEEDIELALSLVLLAEQRGVILSDELLHELEQQRGFWKNSVRTGKDVWAGFSTGQANSMFGLSAAMVSDFTVVGDARDLVTQARLWPEHDPVILALAGTGMVLTAATVATMGGSAAVKGGVSFIKMAKKMGKLSEGLTSQLSKISKDVIDGRALRDFSEKAKSIEPSRVASGRYWNELGEASSKIISGKKAVELTDAGSSVRRIGASSGLPGALDALGKADSVGELRRLEKVSDTLGDGFRGALKILPDIGKSAYRVLSVLFSLLLSLAMALLWLLGSLWTMARWFR
ncbi:hypothetical protein [Zobellella taiwanensis]